LRRLQLPRFEQIDAMFSGDAAPAVGALCEGVKVNMRSPIEIRNDAMDCFRLAEQAKGTQRKSMFLLMAQAWTMLAQQAEGIAAQDEAVRDVQPTTH
jgi:hypothetical protein